MQQILGVFGYLEMDAGQGGDFGFYILLAQQVQDMVINVNCLRKYGYVKTRLYAFQSVPVVREKYVHERRR